ncbi:hypothetical protein ACA910_017553 [Epithemia clementina (nom. ined.)]
MQRWTFLCLLASLACFFGANQNLYNRTTVALMDQEVTSYGDHDQHDYDGKSLDDRVSYSSLSSEQPGRRGPRNHLEFTVNQTQYLLETLHHSKHGHDQQQQQQGIQDETNKRKNLSTIATKSQSIATSRTGAAQESRLSLCSRDEILQGAWVPTLLDKGAPYISTTEHLRCHPKSYYQQVPFPTWKWQVPLSSSSAAAAVDPSPRCDWTDWQRSLFCQVAQYATILIVGDSLSWEHYSSLVQLSTGRSIHQGFQHQSKLLQQSIVHTACPKKNKKHKEHHHHDDVENTVRLVFRRDDKLLNLSQAIQEDFPTILVLNRGAHYVESDQLLHEMEPNWRVIRDWMHKCRAVHDDASTPSSSSPSSPCHLFWRTSVPGHPQCAKFDQPVNNLKAMEEWIANLQNYDSERAINYHWYDYQSQNELFLQELESRFGPPRTTAPAMSRNSAAGSTNVISFSYGILDAYYLNVLRPDEHRAHQGDCLHNCYPGKMDVISQLLLHYLRMYTTAEHVQERRHWWERQEQRLPPGQSLSKSTVYNKKAWTEAQRRGSAKDDQRREGKHGHHHSHRHNQ